jgi:hypothetical protein
MDCESTESTSLGNELYYFAKPVRNPAVGRLRPHAETVIGDVFRLPKTIAEQFLGNANIKATLAVDQYAIFSESERAAVGGWPGTDPKSASRKAQQ